MCFYWVQDRCNQKHFLVYWKPGKYNMGDYHTKFHFPSYQKKERPLHVHTESSPKYIPWVCVHSSKEVLNIFPRIIELIQSEGTRTPDR